MPTINENQFFTVIVEFEVDPKHQQALIDVIADQAELHIKHDAGFVSASLHASEDGRRIVNYAQWDSRKAWSESRASGDDEAAAVILKAVKRYDARQTKVDFFRVARVVENV